MNNNYRLTFDFGSGSVKAALMDRRGNVVGAQNLQYSTDYPRLGWAIQKPREHWQALTQASRQLMAETKIDPRHIQGIAIAQTATTIIFVDREGEPMTDCVMWMDGRAEKQARELNEKLGEKRFNGKNVYAKLLWFLENEPEVVENAAYLLDVSACLFFRMTGTYAYEFTCARSTGLVDLKNRKWDERMFRLIDFPRRLVPDRIVASTEVVGGLTAEAAALMGLTEGTPVFGGASDHGAAILGTACTKPGDAHIYIGTSAWLAVATAEDVPNPGRMPSPVPGMRYHYYDTDSGGACLEYLVRTYYGREQERGEDVYEVMNREAGQALEELHGEDVIFLPFLAGASAPIANTTVRATLLNLKASTQRGHIARAVMEGIAMNLRWMRDIHAEKNGWNVNFLRVVGGGVSSGPLMQTLANVLETPVTPLENARFAGNRGLGDCIAVGCGDAADFSVLEELVHCEEPCLPQPETADYYGRMYRSYRQAYAALVPLYQDLNN